MLRSHRHNGSGEAAEDLYDQQSRPAAAILEPDPGGCHRSCSPHDGIAAANSESHRDQDPNRMHPGIIGSNKQQR